MKLTKTLVLPAAVVSVTVVIMKVIFFLLSNIGR